MATLPDASRKEIWEKYMSGISRDFESISINKEELRAVVNAIDDWVDANMASFNNALPEPGKSELNQKQKATLLMYVVNKRWEVI